MSEEALSEAPLSEEAQLSEHAMPSSPARSSSRRRLLVFGLIAAGVIGLGEYATQLPSERQISVRVAEGQGIERVELVWHEDNDVVHRTWLGPPFGNATSTVRLSDGQHRLHVNVHRGTQVSHRERVVEVRSDAQRITVDVP